MAPTILSRFALMQLSFYVLDIAVWNFNNKTNPFIKEFPEHDAFLETIKSSFDIHPTAECFNYPKYWDLFNALSPVDKVLLKNDIDVNKYRIAFVDPRYPYLVDIGENHTNTKDGLVYWWNMLNISTLLRAMD